jgi:hypothetical protein
MTGLALTRLMANQMAQPAHVSGVRLAISPMTSEGMDCSCSCHDLATVRYAGSNEVLLASFDGNPVPINQQCVAALYDHHVFIEFMYVLV